MAINRRQFLRRSAITAIGFGLASPFGDSLLGRTAFGAARRTAGAAGLAGTDKIIVTINLYGGNDGLNTVIPLSQMARYQELRPVLHIPAERVLAIPGNSDVGLNPGMTALQELYGRGKVAIINGVGAPVDADGLFDHEASQVLFQSGSINGRQLVQPTGWVGRYLDTVAEGILSPGIDMGGGLLVVSGASREALTIGSIDQFQVQPTFDSEARLAAYADIMAMPNGSSGVAERNRQVRAQALENSGIVHERTTNYEPAVEYPADDPLSNSLKQCAQLITADLGVQAISVGYDGFDTHAGQNDGAGDGQLGNHDFSLQSVSNAIALFHADLAAHNVSDRVIILTISEFGRRPEQNNDNGTDHGLGSVGFVVGDAVRGGVYGDYPSLAEEDLVLDGNVATTTDFRSVYATILGRFFNADPEAVLGGPFPLLGFL